MKKKLMLIAAMGMLALAASAASSVSYPYFTFQTADGTVTSVDALSLTMTVTDGKLMVSNGNENYEFPVTELSKMYFSTEKTGGVDDVLSQDVDAPKEVYSVSGVHVGTYTDEATLTSSLQPGMYIVKSNGKIQKIAVR